MPTLHRGVKRLALAAALTTLGCSTPDSSGLYTPSATGPIDTSTPAPPITPDAPPGDIDDGALEVGGSGGGGGKTPVVVSPVSSVTDAGLPAPARPTPSEPMADAGAPSPPLAPLDAGSEPASPPVGPEPPAQPPLPPAPECGGASLGGVCWYLGDLDQTCNGVCATHGGFAPASSALVGTPEQGGSLESCAAVLDSLGAPSSAVTEGFREDTLGFGCHLFVDPAGATSAWWLTAPAFAPTVSDPSARLVCGCAR